MLTAPHNLYKEFVIMRRFQETEISKAIIETYHKKLSDRLVNDVIIAGAGPSGMVAAAGKGLERRPAADQERTGRSRSRSRIASLIT